MQSQLVSQGIFAVYKERSETLAILLERFRQEQLIDETVKLTYAGRLDPMASGLVLILAGESRFEKDALLGLPKTYIVDVLLGVSTDTLDPLGIIAKVDLKTFDQETIQKVIDEMKHITSLPYPMYSSVPVDGKPLFVHARAGNTVDIPMKKVAIHTAELVSIQSEPLRTLAAQAIADIQKVSGDFRQEAIIEKWKELLDEETDVQIVTIKVSASSGTYMRSLAQWLGQQLDVPTMAYGIERIQLGEYEIKRPPTK